MKTLIALLFLITTAACAGNVKPNLVKFDATCLTAVQTIASVEQRLSAVGALTTRQSLDIRKALRPVIDLGEQATSALIAWKVGDKTPAALLALSAKIGELTNTVIALLPDAEAKSLLLSAIAIAQEAWAAVIQVMYAGGLPTLSSALAGGVL